MNTKLTMRYPTSWHQDMWREGAPFWKWSDRRHGLWWDFPGKYFDQSCAALARRKEYGTS